MKMTQAMKAIKDERCCSCGRRAKGLVCRQQVVKYYCKECLHKHMQQSEPQLEEAAASSA